MRPEELTLGARVRRRFKTDETGVVVGWRVDGLTEGQTLGHFGQAGDDGADRVVVCLNPPVPHGGDGHIIGYGSPLTEWELSPLG
jgi:hypothetical protein